MYTDLLNLIDYLDSIAVTGVFNTIERHSDGTMIITVKKYKVAGYSREYKYTASDMKKALKDIKDFISRLPTSD